MKLKVDKLQPSTFIEFFSINILILKAFFSIYMLQVQNMTHKLVSIL